MSALVFPPGAVAGDTYDRYVFDGEKWDPNVVPLSQLVNGSYALTLNGSGHTDVPGDLTVTGNLTVGGTTTFVQGNNTVYTDNLIELHAPPGGPSNTWSSSDGVDIGLRMHYYNGGDKNAALVLAQDTGSLEWYSQGTEDGGVFTGTYGDIKAATFSGNLVGTANNTVYLGGIAANQYVYANSLTSYQTTSGLSANVATLTSNNSLYLGGVAANQYAYANSLTSYQTTSGLSANVATLSSNNSLYLGGIAANQYAYANGSNLGTLASLRVTGSVNFGSNSFTKTTSTGDVTLDNGTTDTPGVLMYYANNNNWGVDSYDGLFSVLSGQMFRVVNNLNESGGAMKMAIDTTGNMAVTGFVQPGAYRAGQVIKDTMLSNTDFSVLATTVATSTSDTDFISYSYTPTSSSSYLIIHVHVAAYSALEATGAGTDSYFSRIKVDGTEITYARQYTRSNESSRTGVLFPLIGRYTNSNTSAKAITVGVRRDSADDSITITNSATALWMRITEIAR